MGALVDYLFDQVGVTRVEATLHPDNIGSAQVLERTGFLFEGRTRLSCWVGDGDDAENSDDALYGLTRDDLEAWRNRPTEEPNDVRLIEIDPDNQIAVSELETHHSQKRLVATVLESYADAMFARPKHGQARVPWLRAIEADGDLAGFMMATLPSTNDPDVYLWRLLIDRRHQRRGIGHRAVQELEKVGVEAGAEAIRVTWAEGRGTPEPFYLGLGFEPTGQRPDGEVEGRKALP